MKKEGLWGRGEKLLQKKKEKKKIELGRGTEEQLQ